jgi:hypothetical protein
MEAVLLVVIVLGGLEFSSLQPLDKEQGLLQGDRCHKLLMHMY